ncbi:MAG: CDP-alcohol phosphatidyltransferase family protein [Dehalococcoidia bacterium]|nr:CDP-alcohol phosphatidyltransferase family protein [Dehalococcoidia bacterium]
MDIATSRTRLRRLFSQTVEGPSVTMLARLGVTPNQLTILGLLIAGVAAYLMAKGWFLAAGLVLLSSGFFDLLDGALARRTNRATPFGAVLDSVSDRVGEAAVFLGLLIFYQASGDTWAVILSYLALVTSFMVSYARSRAEAVGVTGAVGFAGRAERILILSIALIAGYPVPALSVISALATVTFVHRVYHVWRTTGRSKAAP